MSFLKKLQIKKQSGQIPVIPDIKMISPKEGNLFRQRDPVDAALCMEAQGAPALSVVTEASAFGGSLQLLESIASAVKIPLLRKDFIRGEQDLVQTRNCGASAVLLICSCMPRSTLQKLYYTAIEMELEPFVETHSKEELLFAADLGAKIVGINNRDIQTLEKDNGTVANTQLLIPHKPQNSFLISESGIQSADDAKRVVASGADAVLVGTAIWKAENPFAFYRCLCQLPEDCK